MRFTPQRRVPRGLWTATAQYLLGNCTELVLLCSLCVLAGISLCFFLGMHLILLLRNKTTNEVVKYRQLSRFIRSLPTEVGEESMAAPTAAVTDEGTDSLRRTMHHRQSEGNLRRCNAVRGGSRPVAPETDATARAGPLDERRPVPIMNSSMDNTILRPNISDSIVRSFCQRLPRRLTAQEAAAAVATSRNLYDRGKGARPAVSALSCSRPADNSCAVLLVSRA